MSVDATCLVCGVGRLRAFPAFAALPRVTSDSRPWPAGGALAQCRSCGAVQKPIDETWRAEVAEIYAGYAIYHQSGGEEQPVFAAEGGAGAPRSEVLLRRFLDADRLPPTGRMVDIGCANGGLLRAFAEIAPGWRLNGADRDSRHGEAVLSVPGVEAFHRGRPGALPGAFDLVTLVHCLEHVSEPRPFLGEIAAKLAAGGSLFVEVPDMARNPFDLLIADHCMHFTRASLTRLAARAGLTVATLADDWVAKELSAVLHPGADTAIDHERQVDGAPVETALAWLAGAMAAARRHAESGRRFGIFGTSIAGIWLFSASGGAADFFVDEDPARVGRNCMGRAVLRPVDVPADATVLLAAPDRQARRLKARLAAGPGRYVTLERA